MAKRREFSLLIGACVLASGCAATRIERAETAVIRSQAYVEGWEDATRFFLGTEYEGQQKTLDAVRSRVEILEEKVRTTRGRCLEEDLKPILELLEYPDSIGEGVK